MIDKIGLIPINAYIRNLDLRNYGSSMIVQYTKNIYELNIENELRQYEEIHGSLWNGNLNIYDKFEKENPLSEPDDYSREYFNKYTKKQFNKFKKINIEFQEDRLVPLFKPKDIHHIFPLMYGGSNKLLNLIYISKFSHDLLHENPLEHIKKYCFQACDYLTYLGSAKGFKFLNKEYDLNKYIDNKILIVQMYKGAIEEEMYKFYKYIDNLESIQQPQFQVDMIEVVE